jgi:hypothetical protein
MGIDQGGLVRHIQPFPTDHKSLMVAQEMRKLRPDCQRKVPPRKHCSLLLERQGIQLEQQLEREPLLARLGPKY